MPDAEIAAFPFARTCPFDPEPVVAKLRETRPVSRVSLFDGQEAWLVTRYDDVRQVCSSPVFSSDTLNPGYPEVFAGRGKPEEKEKSLISMDPPRHDEIRRMLISSFTVRRAESMRPRIQGLVDSLIDAMLAKGDCADLQREFALPIPTAVICWLLGVPSEDHLFFQERSATRLEVAAKPEDVKAATGELMDYLSELVDRKAAQPGDDIISRLYAEFVTAGLLSRHDLADLARQLLIAGHESTASMISLSVLLLLQHPDQLAELRADPSLVPGAVEELLRYLTIAQLLVGRVATEDARVGGEVIRAGEGVRALLNSANRDKRAFDDPDAFDIHRDARHHVAFGFGVHQCLGQPYARVEMQVALETLFRRLPGLRVTVPLEELPFKYESAVHGIHALPVAW
jgi:cytochrome P450